MLFNRWAISYAKVNKTNGIIKRGYNMAIYEFRCGCDKSIEINCYPSEYYTPDCPECNKPMKRVYSPIAHIRKSFNGG